jgi:hypothetical protein
MVSISQEIIAREQACLVGQADSPRTDPHGALYPHGARLVDERVGLADDAEDVVPAALFFPRGVQVSLTPGLWDTESIM